MQKRSSGGCSSLPILLFFIFLVLKLAGAIAWSWWWVFSPLWLPGALVLFIMAVLAVTGVSIYKIVDRVFRKQGVGQVTGQEQGRPGQSKPDILEAEGTEVPTPPAANLPVAGLPAAPDDQSESDPTV
jgi:hypothetical protein